MRTYYLFRSQTNPELRGFAEDATGRQLPDDEGPWTFVQQISPDEEWNLDISRAVVATGVLENGCYLWGPLQHAASAKPIVESDRVEGTPVFDRDDNRVGTIKRLLIEKVSGRVLYVDVAFGGFLGLGTRHYTIPWDQLSYAPGLGGYHTDISEEQLRGAPPFYGNNQTWPEPAQEQRTREYWRTVSEERI
ncbi:PRC-barrel domain-containing protein [Microvirga puerhi]|uniref:PRC-barrel domain-containing protein n=1 Tax=Microvirga puerhi TaxID=2876078 RepID=A0ABS7VMB6_9HYPH|nr:PRC-barrel domain-containing protein [Microvirga puerhi]MBZ6076649.1 PRC-barrel domain-containing protein [Microvirga puerhi]